MALNLYMAPIRGVTNCVYRNTYHRLFGGYDGALVPFIENCNVSSITHKVFRDLRPERNEVPYPLVPQILTKDSGSFIIACKNLQKLGYDTVNWNLGCPHKRIRNRMHGAGLLPHPEKITQVLEDVFSETAMKISLKVRLGSEDVAELFALLPRLDAYPITEVIIHPRTGVQMYGGVVDVDAFERCLSLTEHPVIFNGDINSVETFRKRYERFPHLDTWMIGRGGIINPFLLEEIRGKKQDAETRIARYKELHDALFSAYDIELSGWGHKIGKLKEYWYYWAQAFERGKRVYRAITRTKNREQYISLVDTFFSQKPRLLI